MCPKSIKSNSFKISVRKNDFDNYVGSSGIDKKIWPSDIQSHNDNVDGNQTLTVERCAGSLHLIGIDSLNSNSLQLGSSRLDTKTSKSISQTCIEKIDGNQKFVVEIYLRNASKSARHYKENFYMKSRLKIGTSVTNIW